MKKFFRDLVPLVGICLVAALLLAVFNLITEGPIAENALRAAQETRTRLLASATTFEQVELEEGSAMDSCYEGFDANGESVGYVVETTVGGYAGEIVVTVGLDADNVITGINVGGDNFSETAGLGAKSKEPAFTDQFIGETVPLTLAKGTSGTQDGIIDAIAGATITSTAVNGGVNSAGKFVMDLNGGAASPNTASVQGFAGPVAVTLSLDDAGAITEITIGDAFFNETPGYGAGALEEAFQAQFIGKVPPLALTDIDAISGATITSTAVVNAINQVQAQLSGAAPVSAPAEETAPVPAAGENAKVASVQGFAGPVAVAVDLDENNAITAITIGDDSFAETSGFGAKALEDSFKSQFIGKTLPLTMADIDAIAGATITSTAVVDALNAAAGFAEPAEEAAPVAAASENALKASANGFAGPVAVAVDLDENNAITAITIGDDSFAETAGFGAKALEDSFKAQFIGKTLPITIDDIDAITGATITSKAVVKALNIAIGAEPEETDADAVASATSDATASATAVVDTVASASADTTASATADAAASATPAEEAVTDEGVVDTTASVTADTAASATPVEEAVTDEGVVDTTASATADTAASATPAEETVTDEVAADTTASATADTAASATPVAENATEETILIGSAQGYAGSVVVEVTVDASNTITAIKIGDDSFNETLGFGTNVQRESHTSKFIGKKIPLADGDIDAVTGATTTSNAVVEAVNAAKPVEVKEEAPAGTVLLGSAQGYAGPVAVKVTVDDSNTIIAIEIGDEHFAETAGLGAKAQEDAFKNQFIGKTLPVAADDIDAIAGATITTDAVIKALSQLAAE